MIGQTDMRAPGALVRAGCSARTSRRLVGCPRSAGACIRSLRSRLFLAIDSSTSAALRTLSAAQRIVKGDLCVDLIRVISAERAAESHAFGEEGRRSPPAAVRVA